MYDSENKLVGGQMDAAELIDELKYQLVGPDASDADLARVLGWTPPSIAYYRRQDELSASQVVNFVRAAKDAVPTSGSLLRSDELIEALKNKFFGRDEGTSDAALAGKLGMIPPHLSYYKQQELLNASQLASLIEKAALAGQAELAADAIVPIVEFFPITAAVATNGTRWQLFATGDGKGGEHDYRSGLRSRLSNAQGNILVLR